LSQQAAAPERGSPVVFDNFVKIAIHPDAVTAQNEWPTTRHSYFELVAI
jgi:hypothetical protein